MKVITCIIVILLGNIVTGISEIKMQDNMRAGQDWELFSTTYRPDTNYQGSTEAHYNERWDWKDEKGKAIQFWPEYFEEGGLLELYLLYRGKKVTTITELLVNGKDISETARQHYSDIPWYRIAPKTNLTDQVVQVMMRFRRHPKNSIHLILKTGSDTVLDGNIEVSNLCADDLISRIGMSDDLSTINLWIAGHDKLVLSQVMFDGIDITENIHTGSTYGRYTPLIVTLPGPLDKGSEHSLLVANTGGRNGIRFRAYPGQFHFIMFEGPASENLKWHNFDTSWHHRRPGIKELAKRWKEGIKVIAPYHEVSAQFRDVPNILADYLPDEPDAHDYLYHKDINPPWKRLGCECQNMSDLTERQRSSDQDTPNVMVVNGTFKPAEYFTYGRIADILAMDQYAVSAGRKLTEVYDTATVVRSAREPLSFWSILGCYSYVKGALRTRFPTGQEMRYMALGAVAAGTQSLAYWIYPDGTKTRGPATNPELWHEMGRINGELTTVAHLLAKSYPVDGSVVEAPPNVISQILRTIDDEATLLVLLNKNCHSRADGMQVDKLSNFVVSLLLPPGTEAVSLCKLSVDGPVAIDEFKMAQDRVTLQVKNLTEADIYVIAHSQEAMDKIWSTYRNSVHPNNQRASRLFHSRKNVEGIVGKDNGDD